MAATGVHLTLLLASTLAVHVIKNAGCRTSVFVKLSKLEAREQDCRCDLHSHHNMMRCMLLVFICTIHNALPCLASTGHARQNLVIMPSHQPCNVLRHESTDAPICTA